MNIGQLIAQLQAIEDDDALVNVIEANGRHAGLREVFLRTDVGLSRVVCLATFDAPSQAVRGGADAAQRADDIGAERMLHSIT